MIGLVSIGDFEAFRVNVADADIQRVFDTVRVVFATIDDAEVDWNVVMKETNATVDKLVNASRISDYTEMQAAQASLTKETDQYARPRAGTI